MPPQTVSYNKSCNKGMNYQSSDEYDIDSVSFWQHFQWTDWGRKPYFISIWQTEDLLNAYSLMSLKPGHPLGTTHFAEPSKIQILGVTNLVYHQSRFLTSLPRNLPKHVHVSFVGINRWWSVCKLLRYVLFICLPYGRPYAVHQTVRYSDTIRWSSLSLAFSQGTSNGYTINGLYCVILFSRPELFIIANIMIALWNDRNLAISKTFEISTKYIPLSHFHNRWWHKP